MNRELVGVAGSLHRPGGVALANANPTGLPDSAQKTA